MRAHFVREMPMSCMLRSKLDGRGEVKLQASFQGWTWSGAEGRVTPPPGQLTAKPRGSPDVMWSTVADPICCQTLPEMTIGAGCPPTHENTGGHRADRSAGSLVSRAAVPFDSVGTASTRVLDGTSWLASAARASAKTFPLSLVACW